MDLVKLNEPGGMPLFLEGLDFTQQASRKAFYALLSAYGIDAVDSFIISGCVATGSNVSGYSITAGAISIGGEICSVDAHTIGPLGSDTHYYWAVLETNDPTGNLTFANAVVKDVHKVRKAKVFKGTFGVNPAIMPMKAQTIHHKTLAKLPQQSAVVSIGAWDISAAQTKAVVHGLDLTGMKILAIDPWIWEDDNIITQSPQQKLDTWFNKAWIDTADGTQVVLKVDASSPLVSADYDDATNPRGYLVITYKPA